MNEEKTTGDTNIIFVNPRELLWHERVRLRHAVWILLKMIFFRRFDAPILIDAKTKTILDGHHRSYAANRLGLARVPCYGINYLEDESIQVYGRRPEIFVDKKEVLRVALSHNIFPHKTTRHVYQVPAFRSWALKDLKNKLE